MDGGDISSFVTNGEWDLIGNNNHLICILSVTQKCKIQNTFLFITSLLISSFETHFYSKQMYSNI